ncbi:MAG: Ig-like domain-containing protein, partial [SAR324 cluster bacterium]
MISVTSTFSESVIVDNSSGIPTLTLVIGSTDQTATYASGSSSSQLIFQYTIQAGDTDSNGISIGANVLALNSGTIRDAAGNNATLTHSALSDNSSYMVDTTAPTASWSAATDNVGTVTGALTSGGTTDDTAFVLSGTNESGSSVKVYNSTTELANATVSGTSWSYTATLVDGTTYQFNVKETDLAGNTSNATSNFAVTGDTTSPILSETTSVPSLTNDNSTQYTFSSSEGGTISIGGSCSSDNSTAVADNMTVSFADLEDGTYSNCSITVADSAGNTQIITVNSFTIDTIAPILSQVTAITSPTNDNTSSYTFSSTEAGSITYGGSCSSSTTTSTTDNNTVTFNALSDGTYSNCKISVTDDASNISDNLSVNSFTIDTVKPILAQVTAVTTPTNDTTPGYSFSSDEAGTISYGGSSCSPGGTSAIDGTNSISFGTLSEGSYSCTITVTDSAENASSALSANTFVIDTTAPTVSSISSSTSDGAYKLDDNITVTVTFDENVIVDNSSGNPRIQLETGTNDRYATYISGNSTSILSFLYTVQSGDNSSDLGYKSSDSLFVNSGTIRDNATNDATLTLFSPNQSGSLRANKAIVIDGIEPTVSSIYPTDNQSGISITDNITVTFSESIDTSSVTTNSSNTSCSGSFQLSSDNFSSCIQMSSSPSSSNSDKTFTVNPSDNLSYGITYLTRVTTGVKDTVSNALSSQYETSSGFKTIEQIGGSLQGAELNLSTVVTTFAGSSSGSTDATGTSASFSSPYGITTDGTNLYVVDYGNNRIRQIVISTGVVTTLAGSSSGSTDATGTSASFNTPLDITTDGTNLYVADYGNHRIRQIVISTGVVTTLAGSSSGSTDATGTSASFSSPYGIT